MSKIFFLTLISLLAEISTQDSAQKTVIIADLFTKSSVLHTEKSVLPLHCLMDETPQQAPLPLPQPRVGGADGRPVA